MITIGSVSSTHLGRRAGRRADAWGHAPYTRWQIHADDWRKWDGARRCFPKRSKGIPSRSRSRAMRRGKPPSNAFGWPTGCRWKELFSVAERPRASKVNRRAFERDRRFPGKPSFHSSLP